MRNIDCTSIVVWGRDNPTCGDNKDDQKVVLEVYLYYIHYRTIIELQGADNYPFLQGMRDWYVL